MIIQIMIIQTFLYLILNFLFITLNDQIKIVFYGMIL